MALDTLRNLLRSKELSPLLSLCRSWFRGSTISWYWSLRRLTYRGSNRPGLRPTRHCDMQRRIWRTNSSEFKLFWEAPMHLIGHPVRTRSPFPSHDVIVLSKPSSFAEVGMASLMFAEANMDPFLHQQGNQPVTTEVPVGNNDIPSLETRQEMAKHSNLASVFPLILPDRSIQ